MNEVKASGARRAAAAWLEALRFAVEVDGLLALGAIATVVTGLEWVGTLPWSSRLLAIVLARVIPSLFFYFSLRNVARGRRRLPAVADFRDSWDSLIFPLLQLAAVGVWFWGPTLVAAHATVGLPAFIDRYEGQPMALYRRRLWPGYAALGCSLLLVPATAVAAVSSRRTLSLLDPSRGLRCVAPTTSAYLATFAGLCALALLTFVLDTAGAALRVAMPIPLVAPVIRHLLALAPGLAQSYLLGAFVAENRDRLAPARPLAKRAAG